MPQAMPPSLSYFVVTTFLPPNKESSHHLQLSPIQLLFFKAICVKFYSVTVLGYSDIVAGFYGFPTKSEVLSLNVNKVFGTVN